MFSNRAMAALAGWFCVLCTACHAQVYPGATWQFQTPASLGLDVALLDQARDYIGGRGCVVRHGYMGYTWGDQSVRQDIASACKPFIAHFLFRAVENGLIPSVDTPVLNYQPCLNPLNAGLGFKDRNITFRHMANQISCYGVSEAPGAAFDYNDWQMALLWDTLFLNIYSATFNNVDTTVFRPLLTDVLQCQDNPTMTVFGPGDRAGRIGISVRDFARFGLLYLRQGNWNGTQLISQARALAAVTSPLSNSIPRTTAVAAEMCPGQRTIGSGTIPDNQTDHDGSYSWTWWANGLSRTGARKYPDCPLDTYGALGHGNGQRAVIVIPSLDLVISWNDTSLGSKSGNPGEAIKRIVAAVLPDTPLIVLNKSSISRVTDYLFSPSADTFTVTNGGTNTLAYTVSSNQPWLSVSPTSGSSTGEADTITVTYDSDGHAIGTYLATITVTDNGSVPAAANSPQTINVSVTVRGVLPDINEDGDVDQTDFATLQICYSPSPPVAVPPTCTKANFNNDEVVDQTDLSILLACISGSGVPADRTCDDSYQ